MKLTESEAYYAGVQAFIDGKPVGANPFQKWSVQSQDWHSGYHTRRMESKLNDYRLMDITNDEQKFVEPAAVEPKHTPHYYYGYGARMQYLDYGVKCTMPPENSEGYQDWVRGYHDATKAWHKANIEGRP